MSVGSVPSETSITSPWFNRIIFLLSLIGLLVAGYLWYLHATHQNIPCGPSNGCATVAASKYAHFPPGRENPLVAAYGTVGYIGIALLSLLRTVFGTESQKAVHRDRILLTLILLGGVAGTLFSGWLTYIELFVIHALCKWCLGSQTIIALVAIISAVEWFTCTQKIKTQSFNTSNSSESVTQSS